MSVLFNNAQGATTISGPVKVVTVYDNVVGCPNSSRTNPLISATITVNAPSHFLIKGSMVRRANDRSDAYLNAFGPAGSNYAGGAQLSPRLNWSGSISAMETVVFDSSIYGNAAGTYTFTITAAAPTIWGCGRTHGKLMVLAMEVA